jgi:hypothetical protein
VSDTTENVDQGEPASLAGILAKLRDLRDALRSREGAPSGGRENKVMDAEAWDRRARRLRAS